VGCYECKVYGKKSSSSSSSFLKTLKIEDEDESIHLALAGQLPVRRRTFPRLRFRQPAQQGGAYLRHLQSSPPGQQGPAFSEAPRRGRRRVRVEANGGGRRRAPAGDGSGA